MAVSSKEIAIAGVSDALRQAEASSDGTHCLQLPFGLTLVARFHKGGTFDKYAISIRWYKGHKLICYNSSLIKAAEDCIRIIERDYK